MRPTPSDLQDIFEYFEGNLYWRHKRGSRALAGQRAGHTEPERRIRVVRVNGHACTVGKVVWALHRGTWPTRVYHLNGDTLDNRIENLSDRKPSCPCVERKRTARSPLPGVAARGKRWSAKLSSKGQTQHLGTFDSAEEAHAAFKKAHVALYGTRSAYAWGVRKCL